MNPFRAAIRQTPNFITLLNLTCGFIAILLAFDFDTLQYAPYFIFMAAIFDFADGFAARLLKAYSELGVLAFQLVKLSFGQKDWFYAFIPLSSADYILMYLPVLIPIFSAIRLAKFNLDERQSTEFIGLPTPASALLITFILFVVSHKSTINFDAIQFLINRYTLTCVIIIDSVLMVSNLPMFSLKFKNLSWKENTWRYIFIVLSIALVLLLKVYALPLIIVLYVLLSIVKRISNSFKFEKQKK
jgi:CDP-diacylglycerol--serine O-phosphatidyltransferase